MKPVCNAIRHELITRDLTAEERAHLEVCDACRRIASVGAELSAALKQRPPVEPTPFFEAAMIDGVLERGRSRETRLVVALTAAVGAASFACILASGVRAAVHRVRPAAEVAAVDRDEAQAKVEVARLLLRLGDLDESMASGADWDRITASISAYDQLAKLGEIE
jgi:hypothetical protein